MNRTWLGIIAGAAAAAGIGYSTNRYVKAKKQNAGDQSGPSGNTSGGGEPSRIAESKCPHCDKPVKEYEPFCPYCGTEPAAESAGP